MSTTQETPKCQICRKNIATKKLSLLVCPEHYDWGRPELRRLLRKLRERYADEQEEAEEIIDTPIIRPPTTTTIIEPHETPTVVIEPQTEPLPPATAIPVVKTVDQYIHEACNRARTAEGLKALSYDEALEAIAMKHSKDMVQNNYFSHTGKNGSSVGDRYKASNYTGCRNWGENIAWFSTSRLSSMSNKEIGDKIFNQWWTSPGHHKNIMSSDYSIEGIGIYISGSKCMATQDFCRK